MNGKRRCENNESVNIVKAEFRKTEDHVMPDNFEPGYSLKDMLRRGLQELNPQAEALQLEKEGGKELFTSNHKSISRCFPYPP